MLKFTLALELTRRQDEYERARTSIGIAAILKNMKKIISVHFAWYNNEESHGRTYSVRMDLP